MKCIYDENITLLWQSICLHVRSSIVHELSTYLHDSSFTIEMFEVINE